MANMGLNKIYIIKFNFKLTNERLGKIGCIHTKEGDPATWCNRDEP